MKLLIFPGGGNPDSPLHAEVYGLLVDHAPAFGYSAVDKSVRWPGHSLRQGHAEEVLTFQGALAVAKAVLQEYERSGEQYDILARSFGTYVAIKSTMQGELKGLRRIVLWGALPFWVMWEMFVRDLAAGADRRAAKGLHLDDSFFPSLEPVESLLHETMRTVLVASGSEDKYSTPLFHAYLMQLMQGAVQRRGNIHFCPVVKGAPHEVTATAPSDVVQHYLACIFG